MSLVQMPAPERRPSPNLAINLSSNNPFRNRAASPTAHTPLPSPQAPTFNNPSTPSERPVSRNPFLDHSEVQNNYNWSQRSNSPEKAMSSNLGTNIELSGNAVELFNNLTLNFNPQPNGTQQTMVPPKAGRPPYTENIPPPIRGRTIPLAHRPSRSQEDENQRLRGSGKPRVQALDIFADPSETVKHRRPRRNSESSVADKSGRLLDPDDERRRRERRHREREGRHRGEGRRPQTAKPKKPNQHLDLIDQLDVTSIYGTGLFHHDGPFDACNPHRNRKGSQRAPMQAFPKDSANNALGGSGPVHKNIDFAQFHGRGAEGFTDYSTSGTASTMVDAGGFDPYPGVHRPGPGIRPAADRSLSFNPASKVEQVHGDESMGLGTSTFLEGAPASRNVMQRRESESDQNIGSFGAGGGLGRKKSLVQKIKGISNVNRGAGTAGRVTSPTLLNDRTTSPTNIQDGQFYNNDGTSKRKETNPFFDDYDEAYEKKGAKIQIAEENNRVECAGYRERALSSPHRAIAGGVMERRVTNDGTGMSNGEGKSGGGFLARVKSLKGGRRQRPEIRE